MPVFECDVFVWRCNVEVHVSLGDRLGIFSGGTYTFFFSFPMQLSVTLRSRLGQNARNRGGLKETPYSKRTDSMFYIAFPEVNRANK